MQKYKSIPENLLKVVQDCTKKDARLLMSKIMFWGFFCFVVVFFPSTFHCTVTEPNWFGKMTERSRGLLGLQVDFLNKQKNLFPVKRILTHGFSVNRKMALQNQK